MQLTKGNLHISKQGLDKFRNILNRENTNQEQVKEAKAKTKNQHWMENKIKPQKNADFEYMTKLSRKQMQPAD